MSNHRLFWFTRALFAMFVSTLICILLATRSHAQAGSDQRGRKLLYKVDPDYPWDLKRAHIGGVVRMVVIVNPHGSVDSISVIGGNPVLVETAQRAVKKWKYVPADSESIIHVNVDFDPRH
jgi:TonB family protein